MNKDELEGGARYIGGRVEKTVGDTINDREWQVDGVVDQVKGGVQHSYGRAKSIAGNAIDHAPELIESARARLKDAGERVAATAEASGRAATRSAKEEPLLWALGAALAGYGIAWLVHGRRD